MTAVVEQTISVYLGGKQAAAALQARPGHASALLLMEKEARHQLAKNDFVSAQFSIVQMAKVSDPAGSPSIAFLACRTSRNPRRARRPRCLKLDRRAERRDKEVGCCADRGRTQRA
eukprot:2263791-Rhodomonas_salina.3